MSTATIAAALRAVEIARATGRGDDKRAARRMLTAVRRELAVHARLLDRPLRVRRFASKKRARCMRCSGPIAVGDAIAYLGPRRALCSRCSGEERAS